MSIVANRDIWNAIKADYVNTYAYRICSFLFTLYPEEARRVFGDIEGCVREVKDDAEVWIEKWLPNYFSGIVARVKGTSR
ncbi:hypothetical protein DRH29_04260 [candidate division Kazan bacterium]|uniref:Uncharacterized protein n=1 Tax=candidate division Kazan bacterium TaxID=2202143 RepID=A0A420ZBR5_UNCK3|nr:MAG: hypothetical protein DRH29_04260 [candidate division Kazan bacterium]